MRDDVHAQRWFIFWVTSRFLLKILFMRPYSLQPTV